MNIKMNSSQFESHWKNYVTGSVPLSMVYSQQIIWTYPNVAYLKNMWT